MRLRNFGGNLTFSPGTICRPGSEEELLELMRRNRGARIRARGSLHSWSGAPATEGVLIEMERFDQIHESGQLHCPTARVGAGCRLEPLVDRLRESNVALPTLGAVLEQTISGAISTGTHGSGNRSLSSFVRSIRLATLDARGEPAIRTIGQGSELLAARCALGTMGIITEVELELTPLWFVEERFEKADSLDEILAGENDWPLQQFFLVPYRWSHYVFRRRRTVESPSWIRSHLYKGWNLVTTDALAHGLFKGLVQLQRLGSNSAVTGFFRHVLPRMLVTGMSARGESTMMLTLNHHWFRHLEMEIFVPAGALEGALELVRDLTSYYAGDSDWLHDSTIAALERAGLRDRVLGSRSSYAHHYPIFVRRVLPDETLISMSSRRTSEPWWYSISLFSYLQPRDRFYSFADSVLDLLHHEYGARPHWGKYHRLGRLDVDPLYPRIDEFRDVCRNLDPGGVFTNDYTETTLGLGRRLE